MDPDCVRVERTNLERRAVGLTFEHEGPELEPHAHLGLVSVLYLSHALENFKSP